MKIYVFNIKLAIPYAHSLYKEEDYVKRNPAIVEYLC